MGVFALLGPIALGVGGTALGRWLFLRAVPLGCVCFGDDDPPNKSLEGTFEDYLDTRVQP